MAAWRCGFRALVVGLALTLARGVEEAAPPAQPKVKADLTAASWSEQWQARSHRVRMSQIRYQSMESELKEALDQFQQGKIDRALLLYLGSLERWGRHPTILAALARYFLLTHDWPKFRSTLQQLEAVESESTALILLSAEKNLLDGEISLAREKLEALLNAGAPIEGRARLLLAMLCIRDGEKDRARLLVGSVHEEELGLHDSRAAYERLQKFLGS